MWIESMNNFEIQCIKEGLLIDKAGLSITIQWNGFKWIKRMICICEHWHHSGLQGSTKHFMCSPLDKMKLVRNLGHGSWARHRIWLDHYGEATELRIR